MYGNPNMRRPYRKFLHKLRRATAQTYGSSAGTGRWRFAAPRRRRDKRRLFVTTGRVARAVRVRGRSARENGTHSGQFLWHACGQAESPSKNVNQI